MNDFMRLYEEWSRDAFFEETTRAELAAIARDEKEIEDCFYRDLSFGTGGLRGVIGAGTNRMNVYTVAKATAGMAEYIKKEGRAAMEKGVVISRDSRHFSREFAETAAGVLTKAGIRVYLSDSLRPVPQLSYAVRHFKAIAGIMITASHNPPKYNGFKVYGEDGGQVTLEIADVILSCMESIKDVRVLTWHSLDEAKASGLLTVFGEEFDYAYTEMLAKLVIDQGAIDRNKDMSIVYTALHGSGNKPVQQILSRVGFANVHIVPEQEKPDGAFPTVKSPNPEDPAALAMGIELAKKSGASLVIGTDPDCDRVGIAVKTAAGDFTALTGNQVGILLLDYILSAKKDAGTLPEDSFAVTTIVSSRLTKSICGYYGVELQSVLTGFKFIGERIRIDDEEGDKFFQFGFEESYGYLAGTQVRDKDGVVASMLIAGMAAQSADRGETLVDRLEALYQKFGYGYEDAVSFTLEGKEGSEKIAAATAGLRTSLEKVSAAQDAGSLLSGVTVRAACDYKTGKRYDFAEDGIVVSELTLPSSDVLIYEVGGTKGLDWLCVRPSGTEPKLKVYFGAYGESESSARATLVSLKERMSAVVAGLL